MTELVAPSLTQMQLYRSLQISGIKGQWQYIVRALEGPSTVDRKRIESAMRCVQVSYPILATRLRIKDGCPFMHRVDPHQQAVPLRLHELPINCTDQFVNLTASRYADIALDLADEPPYRLVLLYNEDRATLVFTFHHLFVDAKGGDLICRLFSDLYLDREVNCVYPNFFTYIEEEQRFIDTGVYDRLLGRLEGWLDGVTQVPVGYARDRNNVRIETRDIDIDQDLSSRLARRASQLGVSAVAILLAAVHAGFLATTGSAPSLVYLAHDLRRGRFTNTVGQFADFVAVRFPDGKAHFTDDYLRALFRNVLFSIQHALPSEYFSSRTRIAWIRSRYAAGFHNAEIVVNYSANMNTDNVQYAHIKLDNSDASVFRPYALDFRKYPDVKYHGTTCDIWAAHSNQALRLRVKWAIGIITNEMSWDLGRAIVSNLERYAGRTCS